ncbi:hypothetical protein [uncultured Draconibacterium sp.]|uniref:hypothetical protein n=1 Tax=uncultured Draconibacterium sp. TaxID=1573823 RepID=UPI0029C8AECF|nr:hypothetical protein [uncultured Draconibacterium sp.]
MGEFRGASNSISNKNTHIKLNPIKTGLISGAEKIDFFSLFFVLNFVILKKCILLQHQNKGGAA